MSEKKKIIMLPDLVPTWSELGQLARRLIEYADLSCIIPILDELQSQGRNDDVREVKKTVGAMLANPHLDWQFAYIRFAEILWLDIFDLPSSLAHLDSHLARNETPSVEKKKGDIARILKILENQKSKPKHEPISSSEQYTPGLNQPPPLEDSGE